MSKTLEIVSSTGSLRLSTTNYSADGAGTSGLAAGTIRFRGSNKRLEYATSTSNTRYLQGYDLGATSQANGSIWGSSGTPGGRHRLYVAYGGRRYGFLPHTVSSISHGYFGISNHLGTGWRSNTYDFPAVPSGRRWIVTDYDLRGYRSQGSNATKAALTILRNGSADVTVRDMETHAGTSSNPVTWSGSQSLTSMPGNAYILYPGDRLRLTVSLHNTGAAMAYASISYVNVATSESLPLVQ